MKRLAVFGFGLIGASIAAAVRRAAPAVRITAIDVPAALDGPEVRQLSDERLDSTDRTSIQQAAAAADLCVLAAPVSVIARALPMLLETARVVTDCGSTKRSICAGVAALPRASRFVPGHPMAGGPEGGAGLSRAELFQGQTWLVCPENSDADALLQVENLIALVGAKSVHLSVADHDRAVAYTSHAPQLFASALSVLAERAGAVSAAGPAYRATTRSAGGSESMWGDIFTANADEIGRVLRELARELNTVADGLSASPTDSSAALNLLAQARALRAR